MARLPGCFGFSYGGWYERSIDGLCLSQPVALVLGTKGGILEWCFREIILFSVSCTVFSVMTFHAFAVIFPYSHRLPLEGLSCQDRKERKNCAVPTSFIPFLPTETLLAIVDGKSKEKK
jgi:hypothetical protein